ncbi:hypothetical protein FIE12Z_12338 [Fusarium flagelliforme]|uniref:Uncharacterized protein n=1 Tax=Fusarium flagelliforme TaxID=2675880 RepID=A0A395M6D3_9HYPO|nr:hypothetical protein FIE12Z_12338 [Fusarium flagelliforme]
MMRSKGPPRNGHDLHFQLSISNGGHIFRHWAAAHCTEDLQWINSWQDVLGWKASSDIPDDINKDWQYQLNNITAQWPGMVKCIEEINNPYTAADRRQHLAEQTHDLALIFLSETETSYRLCVSTYEIGMKLESSLRENYPWHPKLDTSTIARGTLQTISRIHAPAHHILSYSLRFPMYLGSRGP